VNSFAISQPFLLSKFSKENFLTMEMSGIKDKNYFDVLNTNFYGE